MQVTGADGAWCCSIAFVGVRLGAWYCSHVQTRRCADSQWHPARGAHDAVAWCGMGGHRRLRIPQVGAIRRRWAAMLEEEGKLEEEVLVDVGGADSAMVEEETEEVWKSLDNPLMVTVDPAAGLRPTGSMPKFWSTRTLSPGASPPRSPSTATLLKRAQAAEISGSEVQQTMKALKDPHQRGLVVQEHTPDVLQPSARGWLGR